MARFTPTLFALLLACSLATPAAVRAHSSHGSTIIAQKSAPKGMHSVYLAQGLTPGHTYRIEVISSGKVGVSGQGFMNYTYLANKHVGQGTKPLTIRGKTPYSYTVKQPTSYRVTGWLLVVDARVMGNYPITVRYRDLGKSH